MFAGLAWGAGYVDPIPNLEFLTVILFAGGFVLGPGWGALAGALGEFLFSAMNPYGSGLMAPLVLVSQVVGMALAGVAGGLVGRLAIPSLRVRAAVVVFAGVLVTLVFDFVTNLASGVMYGQVVGMLIGGVPFALIHIGTNAALFATAGVLLTQVLERTRRSLLAGGTAGAALLLLGFSFGSLAAGAQAVEAQGTSAQDTTAQGTSAQDTTAQGTSARDTTAQAAPPDTVPTLVTADSLARLRADSVLTRQRRWATPPPPWGDGGATLLRRSDDHTALALTAEGGMTERFLDDAGSAEPLGRFGVPGGRLLVKWLGLPVSTLGAVGAEPARVPWNSVGSLEAPDLPVSVREAFRGEAGEVKLDPWPHVPGHPRVTAWAGTGSPSYSRSGFLAAAQAGRVGGLFTVEATKLGGVEPLSGEGDHSLAGQARYEPFGWTFEGAYRSTRQSLTDNAPTFEQRSGEAGFVAAETYRGRITVRLALERSQETLAASLPSFALLSQTAKAARARAEVRHRLPGDEKWVAATFGRESRALDGAVAIPRRDAELWWGAVGWERTFSPTLLLRAEAGAGSYGGGDVVAAPYARVTYSVSPGTRAWAGVARGLGAEIDPRAAPPAGGTFSEDPPVWRSSTWLVGIGLAHRSPALEEAGGTWQGAWPSGSRRARAALYLGESDPGYDPQRQLFAARSLEDAQLAIPADPTGFVAIVASGGVAPVQGLRIEASGHALGRRLSGSLFPSDPDWRARLTVEGRQRFLSGDLDVRLGATGELIGPRPATPVGDLPTATRLGLMGQIGIDEFSLRAEFRNLAGTNRLLPIAAPGDIDPLPVETERWLLEARWTFWD